MRILGTIKNTSWAMPYTINTPNSNLMNIFVVYTFLAFILIGCSLTGCSSDCTSAVILHDNDCNNISELFPIKNTEAYDYVDFNGSVGIKRIRSKEELIEYIAQTNHTGLSSNTKDYDHFDFDKYHIIGAVFYDSCSNQKKYIQFCDDTLHFESEDTKHCLDDAFCHSRLIQIPKGTSGVQFGDMPVIHVE